MKKKCRIIIDILMFALLTILMLSQITGVLSHEILGILTIALFTIHHILNKGFYKTIFKGKLTKLRIIFLIIDILLFIMMILMIISSFLISQHLFTFMNLANHTLGRMLHNLSAYCIYLLCAFHLGLHLNVILHLTKDKRIIINIFLILFALIFGINGFIKKEFFQKLTLRNLYPLYSSDSFIVILIDYLGVFIMFTLIGYGIYNLVTLKRRNK